MNVMLCVAESQVGKVTSFLLTAHLPKWLV